LKGVRIGLPREYYELEGLDPEVAHALDSALAILKQLGAETVPIALPHTTQAVATYYVIAPCEASSNLARYDGVKYGYRDPEADELLSMYRKTRSTGFGPEVQRRIILGTYALSAGYYDAYYGKASQVRTLIRRDFSKAFEICDLIASPVAPTPALPIGSHRDDPLKMYLADVYTLSANLAGIPGLSLPSGFSREKLPIGMQLMGKPFDEAALLNVGAQFQQATDFHLARPPI
ncbi:MAG: amidase family protein, partial [Desulfobacterales bacterium]